jgi:hypothetical protein
VRLPVQHVHADRLADQLGHEQPHAFEHRLHVAQRDVDAVCVADAVRLAVNGRDVVADDVGDAQVRSKRQEARC